MDNRFLINGSWLFYVLLILAIFPIILYFGFFYRKQNDFSSSWLYIKISSIVLVMFGIIYALYIHVIDIYITVGANNDSTVSWLFTLINALIIGALINLLGFFAESKSFFFKYAVFFSLLYFALIGFGYLGILVYLNYPFTLWMEYRKIQSNSSTLSFFFLFNLIFFTLVLFISFMAESEID